MMIIQRCNILGVQVSAINMEQAISFVEYAIAKEKSEYICVTPAHSIMDCQGNEELIRIFNGSGLTTPDGMSIVWLLKLMGHKHVDRVYGPDLMEAVCQYGVAKGWRHFFYGGKEGVPEALAESLQTKYKGIKIAGTYSPPFRPLNRNEEKYITEMIKSAKPDIVWVGISSPKQERWMSEYKDRLSVPVIIGVGAAFDYLSGAKTQAPHWIQRSGLEWLYRFAREPRRLWKRYIQYPKFVWMVLLQYFGLKHYED